MNSNAAVYTRLPKTFWSAKVEEISRFEDSAETLLNCGDLIRCFDSRSMPVAQAYYELISAPRWSQRSIDRCGLVVESLSAAAMDFGLDPNANIDVDGVQVCLMDQLKNDADHLILGFEVSARQAVQFFEAAAT